MVPVWKYEQKLESYLKVMESMIGKRFKTNLGSRLFDGHEVQVVSVGPIEPDRYALSDWNTIVVTEVPMLASRPSRGRQ